MAKELPYFKFEPSAWDNGYIQMCSREAKGLFIDLCSMYWSRTGELPYALALQKLCNGNAEYLQELCKHKIIVQEDEQIIIDFLDDQLNEFQETSEKRRKAAEKRWNNASALQVQSKSNAIREEKRREEKRKEDKKKIEKIIYPFETENFCKAWELWKKYKNEQFNFKYIGATSEQAALKKIGNLSHNSEAAAIAIIEQSIANSWSGLFELKNKNNGQAKSTKYEITDEQRNSETWRNL